MARVVALAAHHAPRLLHLEVLRLAIVGGCALALILARAPLPF